MNPDVTGFFDEATFTISYVVADPATKACAIIDSVLEFDAASGRTDTAPADKLVAFIRQNGLKLDWILETHVHADHLSAAPHLQAQLGGRTGIGFNITAIQDTFSKVFNLDGEFRRDGSQFDHLFADGETFKIGALDARAMHTPGHTPACMTYVVGDAAFIGDTLFMPDYGSARCDFPGGDARQMYRSIQKIFALPPQTRLFLCHDYKAPGRDVYKWETTVAEQRAKNLHVHDGVSEDEFAAMRQKRDATLSMPKLIIPSVQVNMRGGQMPPAEPNGKRYLKLPVDVL
jgi:glyoxylase-like metal-dependent hydrolase (beta-lactamase superfamily II)